MLDETEPADDFDLDLQWGELTRDEGIGLYLPTAREVPGETCDTHNATCPDTCHATCPDTCHGTCPATCRDTCPATCRNTCPATCRRTCDCHTQVGTHCISCRDRCQPP